MLFHLTLILVCQLIGETVVRGIGLPLLVEDYAVLRVASALHALSTPDLRPIALDHLRHLIASPTNAPAVGLTQIVAFLNGETDSVARRGSWWMSVRWAARKLRKALGLRFVLRGDTVGVSFGHPARPAERATIMAPERRCLVRALRMSLRNGHFQAWASLDSQGRAAATLSQHHANTAALLRRTTTVADWKFLHRARLDLLPLNAGHGGPGDKRCRRCGYPAETAAHVLQHCLPLSAPRNSRHHGVVRHLAAALQEQQQRQQRHPQRHQQQPSGSFDVVVDRTTPGASSNQRVDLQFTKRSTGERVFVDVKIPFERPQLVEDADRRNREKYAELAAESGAEIHTLVIGAYGSWRPANDRLLKRLGFRRIATLRDQLIRHVVHWSRNTHVQFMTGVPQTY